jgi:hypothetical protein
MAKFERQKVDPRAFSDILLSKWSADVLDEGFVPFPKRLLRCLPRLLDGPLQMNQLCALLAVVDYERPRVSRRPSLEFLAESAGLSKTQILQSLEDLAKRRLINATGTDDDVTIDYRPLMAAIVELTKDDRPEESSQSTQDAGNEQAEP